MTPSPSCITLRDVRAYGRHGAGPGEREHPQAFDIDVELELDLERARSSDALADTVDYACVHERIVEIVGVTSFALLERLGGEILKDLMRDDRISRARITIGKPRFLAGATPSVTVASTRTQGR